MEVSAADTAGHDFYKDLRRPDRRNGEVVFDSDITFAIINRCLHVLSSFAFMLMDSPDHITENRNDRNTI